jgi:hypothetical protein
MRTSNCKIKEISLTDIKQIAMLCGKSIQENKHTFCGEPVYKVHGTIGLFTFNELKHLFIN